MSPWKQEYQVVSGYYGNLLVPRFTAANFNLRTDPSPGATDDVKRAGLNARAGHSSWACHRNVKRLLTMPLFVLIVRQLLSKLNL